MTLRRRSLIFATTAYFCWGFFPVFLNLLSFANPWEVTAHRIVWSFVLLNILALFIPSIFKDLRWRVLFNPWLMLSALCIGTNWMVFIYTVQSHRLLDGSLGYFINPLVNLLLGNLFLHERIHRVQMWAFVFAGLGIAVQIAELAHFPWIAIAIALSFSIYGLARRKAGGSVLQAAWIETLWLFIPSIVFCWIYPGSAVTFSSPLSVALLIGAGVITALILILFALGVKNLSLAEMGLLQYIAPTFQFILGYLLYSEPLPPAKAIGFGLVWAGIGIILGAGLKKYLLPWKAIGESSPPH